MVKDRFKFRVWDDKEKAWIHGPGDECSLFGETILLGAFMPVELQRLNDMVIYQFTGVKDMDGKDIYDGDVIELYNSCGQKSHCQTVQLEEWQNREDYWEYGYSWYSWTRQETGDKNGVRVLGNMHDNPELVKVEQLQ
jgi:uncharacterized phage protein (TIGR01671 family)